MPQKIVNIVLLISPLLIGAIITVINSDGTNNATEKAEAWTRRAQLKLATKKSWFNRYIIHPILWIIVKFCDWTDGFTHRGLKNGARVAATLYLIAAWCYILYSAFMIALIIVIAVAILYILFKILINSNDDARQGYEKGRNAFKSSGQYKEDTTSYAGTRGQKSYTGTNWFNEEMKGRIDEYGNIYSGTNWFNEEKIGRIDKDGNIYKGTNYFNEEKTGRVDHDGNIQEGSNWFTEEKVGRIDKDGNIYKGTNWFTEGKIGRTGD